MCRPTGHDPSALCPRQCVGFSGTSFSVAGLFIFVLFGLVIFIWAGRNPGRPPAPRQIPEGPAEPRKSARKDYFAEKQKKLFSQFHLERRGAEGEEAKPAIFENVVVWVNGYTEPSETVLRKLVVSHGGLFLQHYSSRSVTHIITSTFTTHQHECKRYRADVNVVRPEWVLDSVKAGKQVDCHGYSPLFEPENQTTKSASILSSFIASASSSSSSNTSRLPSSTSGTKSVVPTAAVMSTQECTQLPRHDGGDQSTPPPPAPVTGARDAPDQEDNEETELPDLHGPSDENGDDNYLNDPLLSWDRTQPESLSAAAGGSKSERTPMPPKELLGSTAAIPPPPALAAIPAEESGGPEAGQEVADKVREKEKEKEKEKGRMRDATDHDFINGYYKASRLHHLSLWRAQFEDELNSFLLALNPNARQESEDKARAKTTTKRSRPPVGGDDDELIDDDNLDYDEEDEDEEMHSGEDHHRPRPMRKAQQQRQGASPEARVIMHVDMDCFFASVAIRSNPMLAGKPVVVAHSNSAHGTSSVASASYEARKYGVSNGMMVGQARELCPDLVAVPYDFDKIEKVSKEMYRVFMKYTTKIQVVSCDEALLEVTTSAMEPANLAKAIRIDIYQATGCTASVGIGHNILLAKLATRQAKPNGQYHLTAAAAPAYLATMTVDRLPGVGWKLGRRLKEMGIETCGDLLPLSKEQLGQHFGKKVGETMWHYARGTDERPLTTFKQRKSVGVDVNWGIRFTELGQLHKFLQQLTVELAGRLNKAGVKGRTIVFKLKKRRDNAPEPRKLLGHGIVDNLSRSLTLAHPTDDAALIYRECLKFYNELGVPVEDVRGIGIQIQKLETEGAAAAAATSSTTTPTAGKSPARRGASRSTLAQSLSGAGGRYRETTLSQQWRALKQKPTEQQPATSRIPGYAEPPPQPKSAELQPGAAVKNREGGPGTDDTTTSERRAEEKRKEKGKEKECRVIIVEGDDEDNNNNGKSGSSTTTTSTTGGLQTANAKRGAAVASGGCDEEKTPIEGSMQKKKRGRPPGSKNKTSTSTSTTTVKAPRKQRKSKAGGGGEEDESFITLTQTLRRNSEKAKQQELERREAKEERKRKRKRQAPPAAGVQGTSDSPGRFDTAAHRGRAADVFREWMASSVGDVMQPLQVQMLKAYLAQLIDEKDLEDVFNILTAFRRRAGSEELKRAFNDVHCAVQEKMDAEYGAPLRLALPFPLLAGKQVVGDKGAS